MAGLRGARVATLVFFALNGFLMGMWIVHIPVVERHTGIGHATLGWLLLLLGGGAFGGMQLVGPLADRFGARRVTWAGSVMCSAALALPGLAGGAVPLGGALLALGVGNGVLDVGMNTHAVQVERLYGRPVMSAFHAMYSIGGLGAALAGAAALDLGWGAAPTLAGTAVSGLVVTAAATPALLRPGQVPAEPAVASVAGRPVSRRVWALAGLAVMLMLCEGVANDWSALDLRDVLDAPESVAALAYGGFAAAMTVGRLLSDRIAARFGPVAIVRNGTAVAVAGLAVVALSPVAVSALAGWTLFGAGMAGCVPQVFSAAGHADPAAAGTNVSRVAGFGYLGMLAGPAVIGPLTRLMPLNLTFFLPVGLCLAACAAAGILSPAGRDLSSRGVGGAGPGAHTQGAGPTPRGDRR